MNTPITKLLLSEPAHSTGDNGSTPGGAITRSADHQYAYDGTTYPGVTSILKVLDKSGPLMAWAARMTAEAAIANLPALPALLDSVGPQGVVKALTSRSAWKNEEARDLGTTVHQYADDLVNGRELPTMPEAAWSRVKAYAGWWEASGWTLRLSEAYIVHPELGYGGTFDLLCRDRDGLTVLADIKTGKGVYPETALQLAAYGTAPILGRPGDPKVYGMPRVDRYAVIHVTATGVKEIPIVIGALDLAAFAACLTLHSWTRAIKARPAGGLDI